MKIRTRYAPSPTGKMHVGNLRTALYEDLIAKHEGGDFLFIDYKQFQKCYGDGNYKSFLATCRDIELLEVPKRVSNGKFRGYAFDKMKNGKKYKVLKVNRKFYDKYCKMTQESKK